MYSIQECLLFSFWQQIKPLDVKFLTLVNQQWGNSVFDTILPFFRESLFWIPLYLFLLLYVTINFGAKGWWWVLGLLLSVACADVLSSQIIKQLIMRDRPCQDPEVSQMVRFFVSYCPGSSSFTSSHATSYFSQAMFCFVTLRSITKWAWIFFVWSFSIAYTQVYVGVHYPFDVFCGAILGCGIGAGLGSLYNKQIGRLGLDK